jgi:ABC-type phosphonate transport system ATPase subunit
MQASSRPQSLHRCPLRRFLGPARAHCPLLPRDHIQWASSLPRKHIGDEPTGALDSQTTQEILDIFTELNASGMTVVVVTHEAEVARVTQRVIWFKDGQVLRSDLSPQDLSLVMAH